jgi:hypothetical protein
VGDYPHLPQKLTWFRRLDLSCFLPISFPSGGGVFYFLGMALSVTDALFGVALWRSIFCFCCR